MSDPATTVHTLTAKEYHELVGRVGALELLTAQSLVVFVKLTPDENRDEFVHDALVELEKRFDRYHPLAARAALETAEALWTSALATVRQPGAERREPWQEG